MPAYHYQTPTNDKEGSRHDVTGHLMPARAFFFAVVDEPGKDGFLVRKIYAAPDNVFLRDMGLSPLQQLQELHPERYGLSPKSFEAGTTVAEHVMGNNMSSYVSTSELFPGGSPRFEGRSIVIDIAKAKRAGAKLVQTDEILTALEQYKAENPHLAKRVSKIAGYVKDIDKEVLVQSPKVPAGVATLERLCAVLECSWMDLLEGSSGDAQQVAHDIVRLLEPLAGDDRLFLLEQVKAWTGKLLERCPPPRRRNPSSGAS